MKACPSRLIGTYYRRRRYIIHRRKNFTINQFIIVCKYELILFYEVAKFLSQSLSNLHRIFGKSCLIRLNVIEIPAIDLYELIIYLLGLLILFLILMR